MFFNPLNRIGRIHSQNQGLGVALLSPVSTSLILNLDASSLILSDGGAISSESDLSGAGNNFAQATSALQPVYKAAIANGLGIVRYSNVPSRLIGSVSLSAPFTATFTIIPRGNTSTYNTLLSQDNGNNGFFTHNGVPAWVNGSGTVFNGSVTLGTGSPITVMFIATSNTSISIYVNGILDSTIAPTIGTPTVTDEGSDGVGDNGNFDRCQVLINSIAFNAGQISQNYQFLKQKWGTA